MAFAFTKHLAKIRFSASPHNEKLLKMVHHRPLFVYFRYFQKQIIQILQQINMKKCPSSVGFRTHDLFNISLLP